MCGQQRAGQMLRRAVAARGVGDRRRRALGQRQKLAERAGLERGLHQHELREGRDQADGG